MGFLGIVVIYYAFLSSSVNCRLPYYLLLIRIFPLFKSDVIVMETNMLLVFNSCLWMCLIFQNFILERS